MYMLKKPEKYFPNLTFFLPNQGNRPSPPATLTNPVSANVVTVSTSGKLDSTRKEKKEVCIWCVMVICLCVFECVCVCTWVYVCVCICMCVYVCIWNVYEYVYMYVCVCFMRNIALVWKLSYDLFWTYIFLFICLQKKEKKEKKDKKQHVAAVVSGSSSSDALAAPTKGMCVCVYMCVCACVLCGMFVSCFFSALAYIFVRVFVLDVCSCAYMHVFVGVCMFVTRAFRACAWVSARMHACMHACVRACLRACLHMSPSMWVFAWVWVCGKLHADVVLHVSYHQRTRKRQRVRFAFCCCRKASARAVSICRTGIIDH